MYRRWGGAPCPPTVLFHIQIPDVVYCLLLSTASRGTWKETYYTGLQVEEQKMPRNPQRRSVSESQLSLKLGRDVYRKMEFTNKMTFFNIWVSAGDIECSEF